MLNKYAMADVELIEATAKQVWGNDVEFGELKVLRSPFPEFEWPVRLYGQVDVEFGYDRSTLGITVPKDGEYVFMRTYTDKPYFIGLASMKAENLLHNFYILDEVVREHLLDL